MSAKAPLNAGASINRLILVGCVVVGVSCPRTWRLGLHG